MKLTKKVPAGLIWHTIFFIVLGALSTMTAASAEDGFTGALQRLDPPVSGDAESFAVSHAGNSVLLSWLEPDGPDRHQLLFSEFKDGTWSDPGLIVSGEGFVANWADVPGVVQSSDGTRYAHWLRTLGGDPHAYGVEVARSDDGGTSWKHLGLLHDDESATEHGFVSHAVVEDGPLRSFWLDGRAMVGGGDTQLRSALPGASRTPDSVMLDERVCECCATDSAATSDGPLIVYRDRSAEEIRDIALVHSTDDGWSEPVSVHSDGWKIEGCPVNGPAVAAAGQTVVVAWYTAAHQKARVLVAWSHDGGRSFAAPVVMDDGRPRGQVDVVLHEGMAMVSWVARGENGSEAWLRPISADGKRGAGWRVAPGDGERLAGVPVLAHIDDKALLVWGEGSEPSKLRAGFAPFPSRP